MTVPPLPVTVFVHVHYPEIWREMAPLLAARMDVPFRLVVTTSHPEDEIAVPVSRLMTGMRVLAVENRGRDVLPFLTALGAEGEFAIGLKLHTKKSPQREDGAQWRGAVLDSLVPPRGGAKRGGAKWGGAKWGGAGRIVRAMAADPRIGFVTPAGFALSVRPWVLQNGPAMARVMAGAGHTLVDADLEDTVFAAGSMFWFRRGALAALAAPGVTALFEPEEEQLDGTAAHATERLFPVEAKRQGLLSLAVPALLLSRPGMGRAAVQALARTHADVASTFFPAPYVAALPPVVAPPPLTGVRRVYSWLPLWVRRGVRGMRGP